MTTAKVFVGSLPPGCKPEELRHLFTSYGVVVECDIMNRCGFVHLETVEMAEAAIAALNGIEFKGQAIVVEPGRPKDRRGGGGSAGAASNRRPMKAGSFNRGGHNSFRGTGGGAGGSNRNSSSNDTNFGPMRNESSFRQQRNAPYSKQNQSFDSSQPQQSFKNKFSSAGAHNDYHNGQLGGNGVHGGQRGGSFGQDRRGFALPAIDHHQQQGRFGNTDNADSGMFHRNRHHTGMNSANRGGFGGRGAFNARRGVGGNGQQSSSNFKKHGPTNGHHHHHNQHNAANSYQSDFPPLGSQSQGTMPGHRNRFNGPPRAGLNMGGGNRRF